jgi:type IV pilus assembly protein PilW
MTTPKTGSQSGFTLVELMVAMVISSVVLGLIVATLFSQQKNHVTQDALVDMQQSMRAAFEVMGSDLKMAGYDPTGNAGATFLVADRSELQLQMDLNGDGDFTNIGPPVTPDTGELIRYALTNDADRDGVADGTPCDLGRESDGSGLQVLAENIDALNFVYFDPMEPLPTPVADRRQISSFGSPSHRNSGRMYLFSLSATTTQPSTTTDRGQQSYLLRMTTFAGSPSCTSSNVGTSSSTEGPVACEKKTDSPLLRS